MKDVYRQIFRHSAVYAVGQLLSRLASLVLLPVYTRYLRPADYAAVAILDLTTGILGILIGSGMAAALTRYHFDREDEMYHGKLWGTGLAFVAATATAIVVPAWLLRGLLADAALGSEVSDGPLYFALALPQLWVTILGQVPETHLRVRKRSGAFVASNLLRLLLNVGLNLLFLIRFEMGVVAILLGNLVASILYTLLQLALLRADRPHLGLDAALVGRLWRYGRPLVVTALLSLLMHNGDRYVLRFFVDLETIGLYSFAYVLGQGVNTMLLFPFSAIWNVTIYEIAAGPRSEEVFAEIFGRFFFLLSLVMLGVSLFAHPVLSLLVAADYQPAADLVPIICLAYLFFSLHDQFRVPALLAKRTAAMVPVYLGATLLNLAANVTLVPLLGAAGAAWASVATFAGFSLLGLLRYRRIARYPYPVGRCAVVFAGMLATYVLVRGGVVALELSVVGQLVAAALAWSIWAFTLVVPVAIPLVRGRALPPPSP